MSATYSNPVLRGNYADPSILRVGKDYYMVNTSYRYVPGLIVWHSRDLVHWHPIGAALQQLIGDVWAPDLTYHKGRYYIYFPTRGTNWVVTAEHPAGPWSEPVNLHTKLIDPGHVVGPDGKRYLHLSGGHIVELADDGLSVVSEPRQVYEPWRYPSDWLVEGFSPEGPKFTYREGWYYLTDAVGGTSGPPTSHMITSARSRTPWGPWEYSPHNPILRTWSRDERWWSQGHGTLVDTPDGNWWIVYHAYEAGLHTLGRHTLLLPIEWTKDGWYRVPEGISPQEAIAAPPGDALAHGMPTRDDFTATELGLHWQWLGEPDRARFSVGGGSLRVKGRPEDSSDSGSPILYMTGHHAYEAEVEVRVEGAAEARFVLYYDESTHLGLGLTRDGVRHYRTFKSYRREPVVGACIRLRIRNIDHLVSFYYQDEAGDWQHYDKVVDVSGYHHNTFGGFLSLRIGLDAVGEGAAVFQSFQYTVDPSS